MKRIPCILLLSTFAFLLSPSAFPQGSLTPPGAPAPTMKSLDQIEARTPISSVPFTISTSGSYYLTANLSVATGNAITINADGVTLDLNGFTISSTQASPNASGILLGGSGSRTNIAISNGIIASGVTNSGGTYSGSGFNFGIFYLSPPSNVRVSDVSVSGCLSHGISLDSNSTVVKSCTVKTVGGSGIYAQSVSDSTALDCGGDGIVAYTAGNCVGSSSNSNGLYVFSTATNCYGYSSSGTGLSATTANNCFGYGSGIFAGLSATTASNCYGYSSSGTGLYAGSIGIGCVGFSDSGTGLIAYIANSCRGVTSTGTAESITHKYNMP